MIQHSEFLDKIFQKSSGLVSVESDHKYSNLGLMFNPFPRSGTANINGSDLVHQKLIPIDQSVTSQVVDFISQALTENKLDGRDKFISATITGNYGSGKRSYSCLSSHC